VSFNSVDKFREEVNYEIFLAWVSERFEYKESRGEININSIFIEDYKFHLACNTKKNVFHCWKSTKGGSLTKLVMLVDKCDYQTAKATLGLGNRVRNLEAELNKFMAETYPAPPLPPPPDSIKLPESSYLINDLSDYSPSKIIATNYLKNRGMPLNGFYYCVDGKYKERIIIPYRGPKGEMQYWNSRDVTGKHNLRYWGPSREECGLGKEEFVYFYKWPEKGEMVILTEGEFDAISLTLSGLWGGAVSGKEVGQKQIDILRNYKVCLSFDNDKWWKTSLSKIGEKLMKEGISLTFVCPPVGYKDWNNLLVERGPDDIKNYVNKNQSEYNQWTSFGV